MTRDEAYAHIRENLNLLKEKSTRTELGRCYYGGTLVYARKDGATVTQHDLDALKLLEYGQMQYVKSKPGDELALVDYKIDSSD